MDALTATVEIIKAVTWPVAALIIARTFREPLLALIPFIRSLKLPGVEVTVAREVAEAKSLAQPALPAPDAQRELPPAELDTRDKLYQLAELAPRAAISEAWRELELAGATAVTTLCPQDLPTPLRAPMSFAEALRNHQFISSDQWSAIAKLRKIRNESVHLQDFSLEPSIVRDYVDTALGLAKELRDLTKQA